MTTTKRIERATTAIPSVAFLVAAGGAVAASLALFAMDRKHAALAVGQLVPTALLLGIYHKLVKVLGSDQPVHGLRANLH